jgi:serine/threonine protein kinase
MNTGWEKINQLFHEALDYPNDSRAEFISRAAEHDPELRHELQSLLNAHEENNSFLEIPVLRANLSPHLDQWQARILHATAPTISNQMIGRLLDGKYLLEELCGRGGMGAVYRAMHVGTGRRVAVKVIAPELAGNREFIERFRREAKTIGRLRHPNIVNVTDFGIIGEGEQPLAYLVMEYLEGGTLAAKLKDKRPLPLADALDILRQTCAAIDEAHRQGVLHRDLKPENIWLEPVGMSGCNVKVLDFGIAQLQGVVAPDKPVDEPETAPVNSETNLSFAPQLQPYSITEDETLRLNLTLQQLTRSGTLMGSPKYMSPEQCRGEKLNEASDIYSLGVITYQMLCGELPFTGTVAELLQQHCEAEPVPLSRKRRDLPASVDAVIGRALAKEPAARPPTGGRFRVSHNSQPYWKRLVAGTGRYLNPPTSFQTDRIGRAFTMAELVGDRFDPAGDFENAGSAVRSIGSRVGSALAPDHSQCIMETELRHRRLHALPGKGAKNQEGRCQHKSNPRRHPATER